MKTILVLTDFSQKAEHAARLAMQIADAVHGEVRLFSTFHASQVFPSDAGIYPFFEDFSEEENACNIKLNELAERLKMQFDRKRHPEISFSSRPGNLAENIEEQKPWLIVMGAKSKASALSHFMFGSNSSAVIDNASCPVLLVPETANLKSFKKVAFASDLRPSEKDALAFLEDFASVWDARITVLHVSDKIDSIDIWDDQYTYYKDLISNDHPNMRYTDVRGGNIAGSINTYASTERMDLVAIAHEKRSVIGQLLHKSIGKDMLNYQDVAVLILNKDPK